MAEIKELLQHREPFLFVDNVGNVDENDQEIIGYKTFTEKEHFFTGHFPGQPIVPGVILVESMAQCGGAGLKKNNALPYNSFVLIKIEKASFHQMVVPNDTVKMQIKNLIINDTIINQSGKAYVNGKLVAKAEWICVANDN